jgi:glycosyltransferase involved in cell wall biosynthesis
LREVKGLAVSLLQSSDKLEIAYTLQSVSVDLMAEAGPAILIRHTVQGLRKAGHRVTVVVLKGRDVMGMDGGTWPGEPQIVRPGLSGRRVFKAGESGLRRLQSELSVPYFGLFESLRFSEAARRILPAYQICHEYHTLFGLGTALACRRLDIPRILTVDADLLLESRIIGQPLRGFHAAVARWGIRLSFGAAATLICVSEAAKRHFVSKWGVAPEKIAVVPNGVDTAAFDPEGIASPVRSRLGLNSEPVIMFVGGFQPWHGLEQLVEAFAAVREKRPAARLLLVGDGPARPAVEQQIGRMGLEKTVSITGYVAHDAIPEWLAAADVVVAPYPPLPEELWFSPLKLFEYMAAGKAIVASAAGQIAEVIQHGHNGLLVRPGDVAQLAEAILDLLNDPGERQRLGHNARRQAVEQHSWAAYIRRLESLYQTVL